MFGPKSTADTFYKWVRTGCHSLPPIFHTYSVWSGGVCPIGKINGRGYRFEIKWEKASFRDFIFDLIIAWNLPTRLCFKRLKKNYGCLKWYCPWLCRPEVQAWLSLFVAVDLQSTTFTPFYCQILSPSCRQFILGCARPAVQSVFLSLFLITFLPSSAPHNPPASPVKAISFSSPYPIYVPLQHCPCNM